MPVGFLTFAGTFLWSHVCPLETDRKCRRAVELVQPRKKVAKTEDVREVIRVMQNSPTAAYIRELSLHERMMLAALLKCVRRLGVEEIRWGDVRLTELQVAMRLT